MNWKVTECYLVALIGIIVLACWETKDDKMFWLHVVVIALLVVFILMVPWLAERHIRTKEDVKKDAESRDFLKEYIRTEEMKKVYQQAEKTQCEHEREEIKKKLEEKEAELLKLQNESQKTLSDFYNFLLIKLAEKKNLLFSKEEIDELSKEFQKKQ